jgi:hypothetical protein
MSPTLAQETPFLQGSDAGIERGMTAGPFRCRRSCATRRHPRSNDASPWRRDEDVTAKGVRTFALA